VSSANLLAIGFVLAAGFPQAEPANLQPFAPYGARGVFSAASVVFFAYIGFDYIASAAEEVGDISRQQPPPPLPQQQQQQRQQAAAATATAGSISWGSRQKQHQRQPVEWSRRWSCRTACASPTKGRRQRLLLRLRTPMALTRRLHCRCAQASNPTRDLPLSIVASLAVATLLYALMGTSIVLMVPYGAIDIDAPFASAFVHHGMAWAAKVVSLGALTGAQGGSPADRPVGGRAAATGLQLCTRSL
jgi:hypothetical protein